MKRKEWLCEKEGVAMCKGRSGQVERFLATSYVKCPVIILCHIIVDM